MQDKMIYQFTSVLDKECEKATIEYQQGTNNKNVVFCVYQMHNDLIQRISPLDIAKFYNVNWQGNIDFIHIPDCSKVISDLYHYPLIIAVDIEKKEVLGTATIKYEEITPDNYSPFFAELGSKKFEITGIMTSKNNVNYGYRGIGSKIYEIAIETAYEWKNRMPDMRFTCEVDCRNVNSIHALHSAATKAGRRIFKFDPEMGFATPVIAYYYTIKPNGDLYESTILVIEVKLEPHKIVKSQAPLIEYNVDERFKKYGDKITEEEYVTNGVYPCLLKTIKDIVEPNSNKTVIKNVAHDLDDSVVYYNMLNPEKNQLERFLNINTKGTELNKNRRPYDDSYLEKQYALFLAEIGLNIGAYDGPSGTLVKNIGWRKTR